MRAARAGASNGRAHPGIDVDIRGWIQRNPYGVLASAVGIGFVLGGGLFTRLAARMVSAGVRMSLLAVVPRLQEELVRGVAQVVGGLNADVTKEK